MKSGSPQLFSLFFAKPGGGKLETNVRLLVSAPSTFQAKEILSRIKSSLGKFEFVEVNNIEFMTRINLRKFEPKESLMLSV